MFEELSQLPSPLRRCESCLQLVVTIKELALLHPVFGNQTGVAP